MQAHDVETEPGRRTLAIVFDTGEEVAEGLLAVVTEKAIEGASLADAGWWTLALSAVITVGTVATGIPAAGPSAWGMRPSP
jgi:hypothetical protein